MVTTRYDDALCWASDLHRAQVRKGSNIPYISHLLSVSALVLEHGGDEDQAIAALLHDAVEDTDTTVTDVRVRFGDRVAGIVAACSDTDVIPKPPWFTRKLAYIAHLADADRDALFVSLADKAHNARTIAADVARDGDAYFAVFKGGVEGTRWYYRRLADVYERRAAELPPDRDGGRSRPGGRDLLAAYLAAIESLGATHEVAYRFEATVEIQPASGDAS